MPTRPALRFFPAYRDNLALATGVIIRDIERCMAKCNWGMGNEFLRGHEMESHSTTILTVRHGGMVAIGGDGQVTLGSSVVKADANKIRRLADGKVITGFAGASADAFALLERFEAKLKDYPLNVPRAATELAKEWRTDRALRRLEALMAVVNAEHTLLISGTGDIIQPSDGILGIGSGGDYAVAAARALKKHASLGAADIVHEALAIAAGIDIYTNSNIVVEELHSSG